MKLWNYEIAVRRLTKKVEERPKEKKPEEKIVGTFEIKKPADSAGFSVNMIGLIHSECGGEAVFTIEHINYVPNGEIKCNRCFFDNKFYVNQQTREKLAVIALKGGELKMNSYTYASEVVLLRQKQ